MRGRFCPVVLFGIQFMQLVHQFIFLVIENTGSQNLVA